MQHKNVDATFDVTALIYKTYPVYTTGHRWLKSFMMKKKSRECRILVKVFSSRTFGETETFIWKVFGSAIKKIKVSFFSAEVDSVSETADSTSWVNRKSQNGSKNCPIGSQNIFYMIGLGILMSDQRVTWTFFDEIRDNF